jgi:sulfatase modifying factor 1
VHGQSLFTGCLIEGLTHGLRRRRSRVTTGSELGLYLQRRVSTYTSSRQTPAFGRFAFDDHGEISIPLLLEPEEAILGSMPWNEWSRDEGLQQRSDTDPVVIVESGPRNEWRGDEVLPAFSDTDPIAILQSARCDGLRREEPPVSVEDTEPALGDRSEAGSRTERSSMWLLKRGRYFDRKSRWITMGGAGAVLAVGLIHVFCRAPLQLGAAATPTRAGLVVERSADASALPEKAQPAGASPGPCSPGMVQVPAGTFVMGSPDGVRAAAERPKHPVKLAAYCIDVTEVTETAYTACVVAGGCTPAVRTVAWSDMSADEMKLFSRLCNGDDRADHPINCVDWSQAAAYCTWSGRRLPTEAEWEYAARGPAGQVYPWGTDPPSATRLNACGPECVAITKRNPSRARLTMYDARDPWETTAPVASFPADASPFGALDMAGNVWEWTADWYGGYAAAAVENPHGADEGTERVFRGGGWQTDDAYEARAAYRRSAEPTTRGVNIGFRCARGIEVSQSIRQGSLARGIAEFR